MRGEGKIGGLRGYRELRREESEGSKARMKKRKGLKRLVSFSLAS